MPIQAKADGNVPFIGPRSRYNILGVQPTWVYLQMGTGAAMNGAKHRTALLDSNELEPVIGPARAQYGSTLEGLTFGGFFSLLGNYGKAYVVEEVSFVGAVVFKIADSEGVDIRTVATPSYPMKLAAGEYIKLSGGTTGALHGIKVRLEGTQIL